MKKTLDLIKSKKQALIGPIASEGMFGDLARAIYETLDEIEASVILESFKGESNEAQDQRESD